MLKKNEITVLSEDLFGVVDFNQLNASLEMIADNSDSLSHEDKTAGANIIKRWEDEVLDILEEKKNQAIRLLRALGPGTAFSYEDNQEIEKIAYATNNEKEYEEYVELIEQANTLLKRYSVKPVQSLDESYEDYLDVLYAYELNKDKAELQSRRLVQQANMKLINLKTILNKDSRVQELMNRANHYKNNITSLKRDCKFKSDIANISLLMPSGKIREALKNLVDFSASI